MSKHATKKKSKLENKQRRFAAVTGASSGIGYELAKQFAKAGFDLLIVAENDAIFEVPAGIKNLSNEARVEAVKIDLASRKGVEKFYDAIKAFGRPLDAIAINAGVGVGGEFVKETDLEEEINVINLNVTSVVVLSKLVLKDMVKRGEGKILITSSVASTSPAPLLAVYAASKAFVQSFAMAVRDEVKDSGVTITSLMPGATETEFFERAHMEDTEIGQSEKDHPEVVAQQGFDAMMAGQAHVVAGSLMNTFDVGLAKIQPETMKAKSFRKENEKVSKKH